MATEESRNREREIFEAALDIPSVERGNSTASSLNPLKEEINDA